MSRRAVWARLLLLPVSLFPTLPVAAAPAVPIVAVMPFKDLSGSRGSIGEAIRETVTTDLKEISGVKVIERSFIDKVLAEQNLQTQRADLDPTSTVKIGKLLGASLVVAGAYQKAGANVRLTARFVQVQTGEIVGSAKVDGAATDFLQLQDRVTTALLKSAGFDTARTQTITRRQRPRIKSLKTIELYGDAVVQQDDGKKATMLKLALNEDPSFVYASRDLDALERRLRAYSRSADAAQEKANRELADRLAREKDPAKVYQDTFQLATNLFMQRRYRQAIPVARALLSLTPPPNMEQMPPSVHHYIISSHEQLREYDAALREGERFLQRYPASPLFSVVQILMNSLIEKKRAIEDGRKQAEGEIAALDPAERADPCRLGQIYKSHSQLTLARQKLEECVRGGDGKGSSLAGLGTFLLVWVTMDQGDTRATHQYINRLREAYPEHYRNVKHLENMLPVED